MVAYRESQKLLVLCLPWKLVLLSILFPNKWWGSLKVSEQKTVPLGEGDLGSDCLVQLREAILTRAILFCFLDSCRQALGSQTVQELGSSIDFGHSASQFHRFISCSGMLEIRPCLKSSHSAKNLNLGTSPIYLITYQIYLITNMTVTKAYYIPKHYYCVSTKRLDVQQSMYSLQIKIPGKQLPRPREYLLVFLQVIWGHVTNS